MKNSKSLDEKKILQVFFIYVTCNIKMSVVTGG